MPQLYDTADREILHLPDAFDRFPTRDIVLFARCSDATQEARGSLEKQSNRLWDSVGNQRDLCEKRGGEPGNVRFIVHEVEKGRMSEERHHFCRARDRARRYDAMIVAEDRTRFLRAESGGKYDEPKPEEWEQLWNLAGDVPLVTSFDPKLTLEKLHSLKSKLGMPTSGVKLGRPTKLNWTTLLEIMKLRGCCNESSWCEPWGIGRIAKQLGLPHAFVQRALNLKVPDRVGDDLVKLIDIDRNGLPGMGYDWLLRLKSKGRIDDLLAGLAEDDQHASYRKGSTKAVLPPKKGNRTWSSSKG